MKKFYKLSVSACRWYFKIAHGLKTYGLENIPDKGPYLVAANHASMIDPPLIGSVFPYEMIFPAKKELFSIPLFKKLIPHLNAFPISRDRLSIDSLRFMINSVNEGKKSLMIFPEGTRKNDKELESGKRGIGLIAQKTQVPILPVYIKNSNKKFWGIFRIKPIRVYFGKPIDLNSIPSKDKKEFTVKVVELTLNAIKALKSNHLRVK